MVRGNCPQNNLKSSSIQEGERDVHAGGEWSHSPEETVPRGNASADEWLWMNAAEEEPRF